MWMTLNCCERLARSAREPACGCMFCSTVSVRGLDLEKADVERNSSRAGCSFAFYHPIASWRIDRVNRRTHRRILVVDGRVALLAASVFLTSGWVTPMHPITGVRFMPAGRSMCKKDSRQLEKPGEIRSLHRDCARLCGREMQEVFERDLTRSRRYTFEDFEKRSLWDRFIEWVMLPFHSQV